MKTRWITLIVLLALALAGCGQSDGASPREPQAPPSFEEPAVPPENPIPTSTSIVEVLPLSTLSPDLPSQGDSMPNPSDPEIQKLITTASEDMAKRFSIASEQIQFMEAAEVVWPDSSLGCPNPAASYIQVLTPGYLIRLQALERIYEYHTDKRGAVVYCENPAPLPLNALPTE